MFLKRKTEGSVICASCGVLVGVQDDTCYNCGRRNPGLWGYGPALRSLGQDLGFVPLMTGAVIILYVLSLLLSRGEMQMMTLAPNGRMLFLLGASGAMPVFDLGRWWTLLTAGWLHGNLLHILFNVMWIRQLAPAIGEIYGASRMIIIYTFASITGFAISSLAGEFLWWMPIYFLRGAQMTVGASAAIFGLLGAAVYYGRRSGSSHASRIGLQYAVLLGIFGLIFPGVDNYAHAGGFLGGYVTARVLDPLKPERVDHMVIAGACLLATLLAILVSIVTALPLLLQ
ncbi:MAG TPA: rhomboid family intramembrane serine protease [Vicinamibacterales bacterium]|nr:rhomboid family intramembrane serine protease [Vicinamibacterales bacterium]